MAKKPQQAEQTELIVEVRPTMSVAYYKLGDFPPNEELIGGDPDPRFVETVRGGLEYAISVAVDENEQIIAVRDGRRRIKALRKLGFGDDYVVLCNQWQADEGTHALASLKLNHARKQNPITDLVSIQSLIGKFGYTPKAIAKAAGMTTAEVEKLMKISSLHPSLVEGVIDGRVKPGIAYEITRRTESQQAALVEILSETGKVSGDDVEWVRKQGIADVAARLSQQALIEEDVSIWSVWAQDNKVRIVLPGQKQVMVDEKALMNFLEQHSEVEANDGNTQSD